MGKIISTCLDCPEYQTGGFCRHKRKEVSALSPACDHAKTMAATFNPEDIEDSSKPEPKLTKVCPKCGRELPRDAFHPKLEAKDGLQSWCKDCNRKSHKPKETPEPQEPESKTCKRCGRDLPLYCFGKKAGTRDGHQYWCKECMTRNVLEARRKKKAAAAAQKATEKPKTEKKAEATESTPQTVVVRETLTDKQMVELLREHGWEVTCKRVVTEEL